MKRRVECRVSRINKREFLAAGLALGRRPAFLQEGSERRPGGRQGAKIPSRKAAEEADQVVRMTESLLEKDLLMGCGDSSSVRTRARDLRKSSLIRDPLQLPRGTPTPLSKSPPEAFVDVSRHPGRHESRSATQPYSIRRPGGCPRLTFKHLPRRSRCSDAAGRFGQGRFAHIVEYARIWHPVNAATAVRSPHRRSVRGNYKRNTGNPIP